MLVLILEHFDNVRHIRPDVVAQIQIVVQRLILFLGHAVGHSVPLIGEHVHRIAAQNTACQCVKLGVRGTGNILHLCTIFVLEQRQGNASVLIVLRVDVIVCQPVNGLSLDVRIILDHIVYQRSINGNVVLFLIGRFCLGGRSTLGIVRTAAAGTQYSHHCQSHQCRQHTF